MYACQSYSIWCPLCRSRMLSSFICILVSWTLLNPAIGGTNEPISSEASVPPTCMLQTKSVRGQLLKLHHPEKPEKSPNTEALNEYQELYEKKKALELSAANESVDPDVKKFIMFAQHKSGTVMGLEARDYLNKALADTPQIKVIMDQYMGSAINETEMNHENNTCLLHIGRNPFEMVVSGYLYHKAEAEDWLEETFGSAVEKNNSCPAPSYWTCWATKGIADVFRESHSGPFSDWLPDANPDETLPGYMQRVDLDAGLIAEFILARDLSLTSLGFTQDYVSNHSCAVNACHHEFYENCEGAWQRIFDSWQIQEPMYTRMLAAVLDSCPETSHRVWTHSSSNQSHEANLEHPPLHDLLVKLRELDRTVLDSYIADLEEHVHECQVTARYAATG